MDGLYQWISKLSTKGAGISYETSQPYMACSYGFCTHGDWTCSAEKVARTCGSFSSEGGDCVGLDQYPNVSISDWGSIRGKQNMMKVIYHCTMVNRLDKAVGDFADMLKAKGMWEAMYCECPRNRWINSSKAITVTTHFRC